MLSNIDVVLLTREIKWSLHFPVKRGNGELLSWVGTSSPVSRSMKIGPPLCSAGSSDIIGPRPHSLGLCKESLVQVICLDYHVLTVSAFRKK